MPAESSSTNPIDEIETVLVEELAIKQRLKELGEEISATYADKDIAVIGIINGAIIFLQTLIRELELSVQLDCIRIASYRDEIITGEEPEIIDKVRLDLKGMDVLLVDDILDTGKTLKCVCDLIQTMEPASLKTCVLLDKENSGAESLEADFVGFKIPDEFVVGYGLDFDERYRHLPCIEVLKPELQNPPEWD